MRRAPHALLDQFYERPYASSIWSASTIAVFGGFICVYLAVAIERPSDPTPLESAFAALDEGDMALASELGHNLLQTPGSDEELRSAASFILGAVTMHDAEAALAPSASRKFSLLAARYLEESRYLGFPSGRQHTGYFLYGKSLHDAGRYAQSLAPLTEALLHNPGKETEIAWLLAGSYFRDRPAQTAPALKFVEQYLKDSSLSPKERTEGLILKAEIHLTDNDLEACRKTLDQIATDEFLQAEKLIVGARLLLAEAKAAENSGTDAKDAELDEAATKLSAAITTEGASGDAVANASFLLGVVNRQRGDAQAAEQQFRRTRQNNYGKPAAFAAGLQEAAAQLSQGHDEPALKTLLAVFAEATEADLYDNEWIPLDELRQQIKLAHASMLSRGSFAEALRLIDGIEQLFAPDEIVALKAATQAQWGQRLLASPGEQNGVSPQESARAREDAITEGRMHMRKAGNYYAELAALRPASREYYDFLWDSSQAYMEGHDFKNASKQLDAYLLDQKVSGRPRGLVALGQVRIAMNDIDAAIAVLDECIDLHPRHPLSYQARLLAAGAMLEKNQIAEARELLDQNMHQGALTPRSLEWRDSLFKLGEVYFREGSNLEANSRQQGIDSGDEDAVEAALVTLQLAQKKFHSAAQTCDEAIRRYPEAPQALRAQYLMAEAHRHAARYPRKRLPRVTVATTRTELRRQLEEDLQIAASVYDAVLQKLAFARDDSNGQSIQAAILRNSYFGKADALFDLERYEDAIAAYSSATSKYHDQPVAIEAFSQIARCYRELDRHAEARGTLEQAKVVLKRIPPEVDFTTTTRYDRDQWSSFLEWMTSQ